MNKTIRLLLLGVALIAASNQAHAQFSYSTDFSSGAYTVGSLPPATTPLFDDGWYVNPATADPNWVYAAVIDQGGFLNIGGLYLQASNSPTANILSYAQKDTALNTNSVHFQTTFHINPSSSGSNDNFGWIVFNANGDQLMSIDLNYTNNAGATNYTLGVTSFANDSTGLSQALLGTNGSALSPLSSSTQYTLAFNIYNIGTANQSVSAFSYNAGTNNPPLFLGSTSILGTDFSTIGDTNISSFAAYWNPTDTNNYGNNFLAMSNVSVSSVPEPQTWILFGLSGLIVVVAFRRRVC